MPNSITYSMTPVGFVRSSLKNRHDAPKQGNEGAPEAWVEILPPFLTAFKGIAVGQEIVLLTWLHQSRREVLEVHPRGNNNAPLAGVFSTRSPDRPNPIGLHQVTVLDIDANNVRVKPLEAIDGTPIVDIKPVFC